MNPEQAIASPPRGATQAQLEEAERGFKLMLRRRFSAVWIEENAADLLAQANVEYAEWLTENPPARNPVGWLLNCANWRAINRLAEQGRRPTSTSLDGVLHLADESTPTPEQQLLDHDRQERLQGALEVLPEKERKLLALVYFRDLSIREAGRKLGWQKSAADRHHKAAMDKLRALVGDRSLLSPAPVAIAAWASVYSGRHRLADAIETALTPGREAVAVGHTAADWIGRQLSRFAPAAEQANAAASSGGGRLAGACAGTVLTVACALVATGPSPVSVGGGAIEQAVPAATPPPSLASPVVTPAEFATEPAAPVVKPPAADSTDSTSAPTTTTRSRTPKRSAREKATSQEVRGEFEVGASSEGTAPAPEQETAPSTSTGSGSSGGSSSGSSGGSAPTAPSSEFGL